MPPRGGAASSSGTVRLKSFTIGNGEDTVEVGECVLLQPQEINGLPYVGRVKDIRKRDGEIEFQVSWYYRPEETYCGRRLFHGQQELFESNHLESIWQNQKTVLRKCYIHSINDYQELKEVTDYDFFTRLSYLPETKQFDPDVIPVYCKCELPYNPDQFMAQCEECFDWFHPECLGIPEPECEALRKRSATGDLDKTAEAFFCTDCRSRPDANPRARSNLGARQRHTQSQSSGSKRQRSDVK